MHTTGTAPLGSCWVKDVLCLIIVPPIIFLILVIRLCCSIHQAIFIEQYTVLKKLTHPSFERKSALLPLTLERSSGSERHGRRPWELHHYGRRPWELHHFLEMPAQIEQFRQGVMKTSCSSLYKKLALLLLVSLLLLMVNHF